MADILTPRNLFERFRPMPAGPGIPGLLSTLQAYGGLQSWAPRPHPPCHSLGRMGPREGSQAQPAAEEGQAQRQRYRME